MLILILFKTFILELTEIVKDLSNIENIRKFDIIRFFIEQFLEQFILKI